MSSKLRYFLDNWFNLDHLIYVKIPEGFGQTEATCSITFCHPIEPQIGHCGPPVDSVMVKLIDVPEMNYFARDGKGEVYLLLKLVKRTI